MASSKYKAFNKKFKEFQPYETKAGELIEKVKGVKILKYCSNNSYDFKTDDNIKYEVKAEPKSIYTKNYFIEFSGYGKPSGISTTKADYYIITDTKDHYYLIGVDILKDVIINGKYKIRTTADGSTFGHIVPCHDIQNKAVLLHGDTSEKPKVLKNNFVSSCGFIDDE